MILIGNQTFDLVFIISLVVIFLSISYIAMMVLLARVAKPVWTPRDFRTYGGRTDDVIFVIPCLNEEKVIGASVQRLLEMDYDRAHVLVIDDGSDDGTADVVSSFTDPRVHLLQRRLPMARQGKGRALNAAYHHILNGGVIRNVDPQHTIIVVVDADGRMDTNSLDYVLPAFDDQELGGVQIGVRINNRRDSLLARMQDVEFTFYTEIFQRGRQKLGSVGLGGNGQFVRLSALMLLGERPWSDSLTEDLDLGIRIMLNGLRLDFCPEVAVHQQGLVSVKRWIRQRTRWFQGHLQAWSQLSPVLTRLYGTRRLDLVYHLTSPVLLLIAAFFSFALMVWSFGFIINAILGNLAWSWLWGMSYLLAFGPMLVLGIIYKKSEPGMGYIRAILIAHLYVPYALLWVIAGWNAVFKIIRGKNSWAKTERLPEDDPGEENAGTGGDSAAAPAVESR